LEDYSVGREKGAVIDGVPKEVSIEFFRGLDWPAEVLDLFLFLVL
jgi:hypothetical protein